MNSHSTWTLPRVSLGGICTYILIREATSINCIRNSPVSMHINILSVSEFVTFGMFYLILCLLCRLQIVLEDCLIIKQSSKTI